MAQGRVATPDAGLDPGDPLRRIAEAVRARLDLWGIAPEAGVTLLNHSENTTFRIDDPATGERRILRIHRTGYHSRAGIESELAWLDALRRDTDIDTAAPLTGIDGERVQEIVHAGLDAPRHAVMFSFLEGVEPSEEHDLPASFERLGEITARLHEHARAWTPTSPTSGTRSTPPWSRSPPGPTSAFPASAAPFCGPRTAPRTPSWKATARKTAAAISSGCATTWTRR